MRRLLPILILSMVVLLIIACGSSGPDTASPEISSIQPESGPPGTMITISGSGFHPELTENSVTINNWNLILEEGSETELAVTVPEGTASGPVVVNVGDQRAVGPEFTVEDAAPGISSVEPDSGTVGTEVTISGMNFSVTASENTIIFGGTEAPVNSATEDQLLTEVPQGAGDGPIEVTVDGETATGPDFDVITDGTLEVVISTSGDDQDDGYQLSVDGNMENVSANETVHLADLKEGTHQAELSDIADNCSIGGNNPKEFDITAADTTSVDFEVSCQMIANSRIVFHNEGDGDAEIFLMDPNGSNQYKLTDNTVEDGFPKVSHDGQKIAFISDRGGSSLSLYMMNFDGSNVQKITDFSAPLTTYYDWSPDGSQIVFADDPNGNSELYVIDTDGSGQTRITNDPATDLGPDWSPDGSKIAFVGDRDGDKEIYTINPDGSDIEQVTSDTDNNYMPRWSPDGSRFVFVSDRDGNEEIYTMNTDGTDVRRVTNNSADDVLPDWSPDGKEIVFASDRDGPGEIYKINSEGVGDPTNLTNNSENDAAPFWSPVE